MLGKPYTFHHPLVFEVNNKVDGKKEYLGSAEMLLGRLDGSSHGQLVSYPMFHLQLEKGG